MIVYTRRIRTCVTARSGWLAQLSGRITILRANNLKAERLESCARCRQDRTNEMAFFIRVAEDYPKILSHDFFDVDKRRFARGAKQK